jgi:cobalt/nickel transport system permease protein
MSHLHIPDGVLPVLVWAPGLALALLLLLWTAARGRSRRRVAVQGALGALVLAAMAVEIPLGPVEFHLTLVGPVGVLLGSAGIFQVVFVANAILSLLGHGGLTVVGLNALVLGAGGALAAPTYRLAARRIHPASAMALATAVTQTVSGALWLVVVGGGMRLAHVEPARLGLLAGVAFPLWIAGVVVESLVALGIGRFLVRVRPDLLPGGGAPAGAGAP